MADCIKRTNFYAPKLCACSGGVMFSPSLSCCPSVTFPHQLTALANTLHRSCWSGIK